MNNNTLALARRCLQAYVDKDRTAIEALIGNDFKFTSPIDNALDRQTYFAVCWPNSKSMQSIEFIEGVCDNDRAFIVYEAQTSTGKQFRNVEVHTARDGKIVRVEVYFGWSLPHPAKLGCHIDK